MSDQNQQGFHFTTHELPFNGKSFWWDRYNYRRIFALDDQDNLWQCQDVSESPLLWVMVKNHEGTIRSSPMKTFRRMGMAASRVPRHLWVAFNLSVIIYMAIGVHQLYGPLAAVPIITAFFLGISTMITLLRPEK